MGVTRDGATDEKRRFSLAMSLINTGNLELITYKDKIILTDGKKEFLKISGKFNPLNDIRGVVEDTRRIGYSLGPFSYLALKFRYVPNKIRLYRNLKESLEGEE